MMLDDYIRMLQRIRRLHGNVEVVDHSDRPLKSVALLGDRDRVLQHVQPRPLREPISASEGVTSSSAIERHIPKRNELLKRSVRTTKYTPVVR